MCASYKRVYDTAVKKFLLGAGIPLGIGFIWLLATLGAITITGASGDMVCRGDDLEPCIAYINFTANMDVFLYINDTSWVSTNQSLDKLVIQRKWGNSWRTIPTDTGCTGSWCGKLASDTRQYATYSYAFRAGRSYQLRIIGYKKNPTDVIKWGFGDWKTWEPVDPVWDADNKDRYLKHIETRADLAWAWSEYEICNPTAIKYLDGISLDWIGQTGYIKSTKIMVKTNMTQENRIPIISTRRVCREPYANETQKEICYDEEYVSGYNVEYSNKTIWTDWDGEIDINKCMRVRIYADLKPALGIRKIEHVPSIFGYKYREYDWWNTTWTRKMNLDVNTTYGDDSNFQFKVNIPYDSDMQADFEDIRIVNSTEEGQLYAWNESQVDSDHVIVWINMSENTNATIWIYYGNVDADDDWQASNLTLYQFQDFNSLNLGDLTGQGGFIGTGPEIDVSDVRNPYEGSQNVEATVPASDRSIVKSFANILNGTASVWMRGNGSYPSHRFYMWGSGPTDLFATRFSQAGRQIDYLDEEISWKNILNYKEDCDYKLNYSWTNTTWVTTCVQNTSQATCVTHQNYNGNDASPDRMVLAVPDVHAAGAWGHWDLIYVANMTSQLLETAIGDKLSSPSATPPIITILSPTNTTYNSTSIVLNWTIDETPNWAAFSVNGGNNISIYNNYTKMKFNDSTIANNYTFKNATNYTFYFEINKSAEISNATLHVNGFSWYNVTTSSGTKSFGGVTVTPLPLAFNGTDYWIASAGASSAIYYINSTYDVNNSAHSNYIGIEYDNTNDVLWGIYYTMPDTYHYHLMKLAANSTMDELENCGEIYAKSYISNAQMIWNGSLMIRLGTSSPNLYFVYDDACTNTRNISISSSTIFGDLAYNGTYIYNALSSVSVTTHNLRFLKTNMDYSTPVTFSPFLDDLAYTFYYPSGIAFDKNNPSLMHVLGKSTRTGSTYRIHQVNMSVYPSNVKLDLGLDDNIDTIISGEVRTDHLVELNLTEIQNQLDSCSTHICTIGVNVSSDRMGVVEISDLQINYSIRQNMTFSALYGYNNVTVWANDTAGNMNYSTVNFTVNGFEANITTNAFELNQSTGTISFNYTNNTVTWWNVTPENQSNITGIFNITWLGSQDEFPIGINASLNSTASCVKVYLSNDSNISHSALITNTANITVFYTINDILSTHSVWVWIDLIKCVGGTRYDFTPVWWWHNA